MMAYKFSYTDISSDHQEYNLRKDVIFCHEELGYSEIWYYFKLNSILMFNKPSLFSSLISRHFLPSHLHTFYTLSFLTRMTPIRYLFARPLHHPPGKHLPIKTHLRKYFWEALSKTSHKKLLFPMTSHNTLHICMYAYRYIHIYLYIERDI
jgi:hypothetical protein